MKDKKLRNSIIIAALLLAFFGGLVAAVLMAKNVEGGNLSTAQAMGFASVALLLWFSLKLLVVYIRKNEGRGDDSGEADAQERVLKRRGALTLVCTAALVLLAFFIGLLLKREELIFPRGVYFAVFAIAALVPITVIVSGLFTRAKLNAELSGYPSEELFNTFLQQRELAEEAAKKTEVQLKLNRQNVGVTAFMLVLSGGFCAFLAALLGFTPVPMALALVYALLLITAGLNRIRLKPPAAFMEKSDIYVEKADFPVLYSLAERAATEVGLTKPDIRLAILPSGQIGILQAGERISLQTGVQELSLLGEDELLAIYRHEFSHIKSEKGDKIAEYHRWQLLGRSIFPLSGFLDRLFFAHFDIEGAFLSELHRFGESVRQEEAADRAMLLNCDRRVAASALIKTDFYSNFELERYSYDTPSELEGEKIPADLASRTNRELMERVAVRGEAWLSMIPLEILARNASHPTLKMRLKALGVERPEVLKCEDSQEFAAEKEKAMGFANAFMEKELAELYEKARKNALETVGAWERAGKPLLAEGYSDVVEALSDMGRVTEAEELAERAIAELPEAARAYACFYKGSLLAKRCDRAALPLLYEAIETENYLKAGLDLIGTLCCRLGDEAELEKYREIAPERMKKYVTEYEKIGTIGKNDALSEEKLDEGELEAMLEHILGFENGMIDEIYLVHQKISDETAASAVIVRFGIDCGNEEKARIMHKIFNYLHTSSGRQYSLHEYDDVPKKKVAAVPNSLVYSKKRDRKGA